MTASPVYGLAPFLNLVLIIRNAHTPLPDAGREKSRSASPALPDFVRFAWVHQCITMPGLVCASQLTPSPPAPSSWSPTTQVTHVVIGMQ